MWAIGTDKYAYRWDPAKKTWLRYGQRKDFARIDAAEDGSAVAVTGTGALYYTNGKAKGKTKWVQAGSRVRDIGLGGGWAWITKTDKVSGGGQVWRARNEQNGDFNWQRVPGGMVHIDAGPGGGAWGVNDQNSVFQFVGGKWRRHAVKATDIGVGGEGTIFIVGTDIVNRSGGGTLYRRDIRSGRWIKDTRRLRTVTAGAIEQPAGVNSKNEIWDKSARVTTAGNQGPTDNGPTDGGPGVGGETTGQQNPDPGMRRRVVTRHSGNWFKLPGLAVDLGRSHRGHIWVVGTDGFAYRWDAAKKSWVRHGTQQDFIHIDAATDGGAMAVSKSGKVYFTNGKTTGKARWTKVADNVHDVGIGGGWAWITGGDDNPSAIMVRRARYDGSGRFSWRRVASGSSLVLDHIDADPHGNAWAVSDVDEIYRFDGGKWKKQANKAINIGIGADNTVWIVGNDVIDQKGGGTLSQYDARTRKWIKEGRRLRSVSSGGGGHPAGTDHNNEIWIRNFIDTPQIRGNNLALRKKTSQSRQSRLRGHATRAVDGNTNGNFKNGSVTDIRSGNTPPWLMVDLGAVYQIDTVRIHNRTDCCGSRLNGAIVETSNNGKWVASDITFNATIKKAQPLTNLKVGKTGRYVRIRHTARQVLGIAEVEVFGQPKPVKATPAKVAGKKTVIKLPQNWTKLAGQALDMGLGSGGHMWVIGTDKYAYRWDAAKKAWVRHGTRQDFERIDVAADGGALAVTSRGGLYFTGGGAARNPAWVQVGGKTRDVGIGGGWVWITSTTKTNGGGLTARARYSGSGKFSWQRVSQGLVHIDAGEDGNAWGVDDQGDVQQFTGGNWRKHGGKKAADIGVGGDNTVWIVGTDTNDAAGGGTLHRFEMGSGGWVSETARLKTVTANGYGQPAGINSANEIWARDFSGGAGSVAVAGGTTQTPKGKTAKITEVAGAKASVPEGLKGVVLEQVKNKNGFTTGNVFLNGNPAVVVTYTPKGKTAPNTIIWHKRFKFSDYMPDAGGTPLDKIGTLNNTAFVIVPKGNENTKVPTAVVTFLDSLKSGAEKSFPANTSLKQGVNLVAGFDTAQMPGIKLFTAIFGRKPKNFGLVGTVDGSIFKNVKQTPVKPTPSPDPVDMAKLVKVYGQTFLKNLVLEGEKLPQFKTGPLTYTDAKYEVSGEADAIQVGFEVSMEMEVKPLKEGSGASTVTFDAIRVDYDQGENTVTLTGEVAAEETKSFVDFRDIEIEKLSFEGTMPEGQPLTLKIDGSGKIKSKPTDFEITLEEYNNKYQAILKLKGELTLAEILNLVFQRGAPPGTDKIALTEVEIGSGYQSGNASLAGENVKFTAFKPANQDYMVAIEHRALQLANYLPQLADTPVKKLGLGRSVFIVTRGELKNPNDSDLTGPTLKVTDENKEQLLPSYIVKMLGELEAEATRKTFGKSIYPLILRPNSTAIIALYTTDENQVSADADSQKVIDSLGIQHETYILKGFVNKDMIRAARYAKKKLGSDSGSGSIIRKVVLPLLDGLDIGFPIPAFQPPKSKGLITFSKSKFRLKGIDGKLETFVSSGMSVKLPGSTKTGVKAMDMVGKVKPVVLKKNLEVEFAATTRLTGNKADETPFARLKALNDPDAEEAVSGLVPTTEPTQGWQKAFGIPFLTVEQMSVGGSFTDGGTTGPVQLNVGMQTIVEDQTPGQLLVLKGELVVTKNEITDKDEITDMVLEIPGSVKIAALPGIKDIPGVNALTFTDVKLSRYELAGQVSGRGATLDGVLSRDPDSTDYALYLAAKKIKLGTFSENFSRKLPKIFSDFPIQSGVMVGSNMDTQQGIVVADLPERAQALFEGIVEDDAEITIAKGLSVFTKLNPADVTDAKFKKFFDNFGLKKTLLFEGAIEDSGSSATPKVRLAASVPNYKIPGVSDEILEFIGTRMVLQDIGNILTGSIEGAMLLKVKGKLFKLEDGKVSAAVDGKDKEVVVTGASTQPWDKAFGIPFLTLNRLELDVNVKTAGPDVDWGIKTKSVLNKGKPNNEQAFVANGKLEVVENVVTDIILELPGTVDIKKLPAIGKIPVINQLSYSDVKLSIYEIAANVLWTGTDKAVAGVFVRDRNKPDETKYTLYGAIQNAKISNLVGLFSSKAANKIPGTLEDFPIHSGIVVVSNQPKTTPKISELPERVKLLFAGYFPQDPDKQLTIVNGVSVYTTLNPKPDPNNPNAPKKGDLFWDLLFGKNAFGLEKAVTFEGSIIKKEPEPTKVRLAASIPSYKMPFIPSDILKFENSEVVFSNEDGKEAAIVGEMTFKARDKTHKLDGSVTYVGSEGTKELKVKGTSRGDWDKAFGIPGLTLSNPTLHVNAKRGDASSTGLGIESDAAFGGQTVKTKGELVMADGQLAGASFTLLGTVSMSTLPGIDKLPILNEFTFTDVVLSRNLIADSNLIAAKTTWTRIGADKKLDAAFIEKNGQFAMLLKVDSFKIGKLSPAVIKPISDITIPNSVVAVSNQKDFTDLDVDGLPESVRKTMFDDIVGESTGQKIKITEGVTLLTKLDPVTLLKPLPALVKSKMEKAVQVKDPVIVAGTIGGVFSGDPSAALYAKIPNAVIPGGPVLEKLLNFRDVTFFIRTQSSAVSQIGFRGVMKLYMPRLDTPKTEERELSGELYMSLGAAEPSIEVAGKMTGEWVKPMGLKDFTFKDVEIKVGIETGSVNVGFGGQAKFNSRKEGPLYYAMDLLVGIIPGSIVPKKLAVQFVGKKLAGDTLVDGASIGPVVMVEMSDSLFRGVLTGSASEQFIKQVQPSALQDTARKLQGLIKKKSLLDIMPVDKIPLPLLSVRDPLIYFSTPGASLPPREGIPAPTLGLGVILKGKLDFKLLGTTTKLADADMGLTLNKGLWIDANFATPNLGPIEVDAAIKVKAGLFDIGSASFNVNGSAGLEGAGISWLGANGKFDLGVTQSGLTTKMNGTGSVGPISRKFGVKVAPKEFDFWSPGECTLPLDISIKASYDNFKNFKIPKPDVVKFAPDALLDCNPLDLLDPLVNAGKDLGKGLKDAGEQLGDAASEAGRRALGTARDALNGALGAANTAASGLKSAAGFIAGTIPFKDGLKAAQQAWGNAVRKVPLLGSALGAFSDAVGGAASTAISESINAAKQVGGAVSGVIKKANPKNWGLSTGGGGQLAVRGPVYDPALENAIKADPNFQRASPPVRDRIIRATLQLELKLLQEKKDIFSASQRRQDLERKRQRQTVKLNELHKEAGKQVWLSGNASDCPHGQYWNIGLGRCWLDGFALLKTNRWAGKSSGGEDGPKCMAVDQSGVLWKDWCTKNESARFRLRDDRDARFKLNKDGTIQTPGGKCLGIREKAGKIGKNPQVLALACSGAKTQKWRFDLEGRIAMIMAGLVNAKGKGVKRLCITQLSKGDLYPNVTDGALHLADCDEVEREEPFDWTPALGTPDYRGRGRLKFPETATLKIDRSNFCLNVGVAFISQPTFLPCIDKNGSQLFAFAFVDDTYFTIASRSAGTCLDARDIVERTGTRLMNMPCHHGETQQFFLASTSGGKVRIGNRKTGQCVSSSNTGNSPFAGRYGSTIISAHRYAGLISASCNNPNTTNFRMTAINDITKINMDRWAPRPSKTEKADQLRAGHINKIFYFHPAGHPTNRIRAEHINYFGGTLRKVGVAWTSNSSHPDEQSHSKFQIVPGLTGGAGTVSLKSVGRSGPPGSLPHTDHYLVQGGGYKFFVDKIKLDDGFNKAATFKISKGFNGNPRHITFHSVASPGRYLIYVPAGAQGGNIYMAPGSNAAFSPAAASFVAVPTN